ncbi:MAG: methionyl-tRNA formyltransferase [Bryobacterales bacterium]|nr:methionyl-tRNA formyltransferase [Bryobacterales bacterium]
MKLVFMGTPGFAVGSLERIVKAGHQVIAVYTQPDRPKGRGQKDALHPVKETALRLGLPVYQPERMRRPEVVEQLRAMAPEAIIVVGYGQIIPKAILDIPPLGIFNVHASLLPKYRGAAPIQWAIANGEPRTGVTIMRIDEGLDTGGILRAWETEIGPEEDAVQLGARLAQAGADLLVQTLAELAAIQPLPQDDSRATYAPILKKEDGKIDWQLPARQILNRIRGFEPWPGGYGFLRGQRLQICKAALGDPALPPGALRVVNRKLYAGCGDGESIELREVQLEGKKRMPAAAFLNGFSVTGGEVLP